MKLLELYLPDDPGYTSVCKFAHQVYQEDLAFDLTHYPEILFAIHDGASVVGCMGLNRQLRFGLFRYDLRLSRIVERSRRGTVFGEQSILALRNCSIGLPVLISVAAAYGNVIGLDKIVYAAIPVSQKTIRSLQLDTMSYGPANLSVFPEHERHLYAAWQQLDPICCILDTTTAPTVCTRVLNRFSSRVSLGPRLEQILEGERATVVA